MTRIRPYPGMVITRSVCFEPGEYDFREGEGITVAADDIVVDGGGAVLRGGCEKAPQAQKSGAEAFSYAAAADPDNARALGFFGTGVRAEGRRGVTIRNLSAGGFDQGLVLKDCRGVTVEGCDFSDCFHDPAWGWDEHGAHGGILLLRTCESRIVRCRANRVWDALALRHSHDNVIEDNDFSHTSDTGLKLWHSCRNTVRRNDFSYGLRIDPGETHARDSAGVLIESGSDGNYFLGNDITHGGDGLFVRVLNGWMSCHNVFEDNDCSYANNNAVEAWADYNTYIGNRANHSSYGFWLGNSDHIVLRGNEAAFNGRLNHNAPEAFGNAGISVVNGSGSHSVISGNRVHDNAGPGIALRHTREDPTRHWLIEDNEIRDNVSTGKFAGHGIYLKHARGVILSGNAFSGNQGEDVFMDGDVSDVTTLPGGGEKPGPVAIGPLPGIVRAGETVSLRGEGAAGLRWTWDFGDGVRAAAQNPGHAWKAPGLYVLSVTADDGRGASIDGRPVWVLPADFEPFAAAGLSAEKGTVEGEPPTLSFEGAAESTLTLTGRMTAKDCVVLRLIWRSDAETDWDDKTRYPVVTLLDGGGNGIELTPKRPMLELWGAPRSEWRGAGRVYVIPLTGDADFAASTLGKGLTGPVETIRIRCGGLSPSCAALTVAAVGFSARPEASARGLDAARDRAETVSSPASGEARAVFGENRLAGDATARVTFEGSGFFGARFRLAHPIDLIEAGFYQNLTHTDGARGETLPARCRGEILTQAGWVPVSGWQAPEENAPTRFAFETRDALGARTVFERGDGPAALYAFAARRTRGVPPVLTAAPGPVGIASMRVRLNVDRNPGGAALGDLTAAVYALDAEGRFGPRLYETRVLAEKIVPGAVTEIPMPGLTLTEGQRYALALGQTAEAESREKGDYYRWIAGPVDCDETFAICAGDQTRPADYDWGTAWLEIVSEGAGGVKTALTHDSDHIGIRFGLRDIPGRYQTFRAPWKHQVLTDGRTDAALVPGEGGLTVSAPDGRIMDALLVWAPAAGRIALTGPDGTARRAELSPGLNRLPLSAPEIRITGGAALSQIEIL